ncbi:MAG: hypothetical protein CMP65_03035 [Flavobacteriales bacterium]|nr:hypothetical protein [Flavobacteriales bacterium]
MEQYHLLIIIAITFFIIEMFTPLFVAASIGIGLLCAALGNYIELNTEWQIYLFSAGLLLSFVSIRPLLRKLDVEKSTNSDRLIGMEAIVTEEIINNNTGRVKIEGDFWQAKSIDGSDINKNERVKIINYQSIVLIVKKIN